MAEKRNVMLKACHYIREKMLRRTKSTPHGCGGRRHEATGCKCGQKQGGE